MMHVATVARGNEVAAARVLATSLRAHHPDWAMTVLVMPGVRPALGDEPFEVLVPGELGLAGIDRLLSAAPVSALDGLMRPALISYLLDRGAERVLLLAPDAEVAGALDELTARLDVAGALLVPRLLGTLPDDGKRPDGHDLLDAGEIDDGIVAVRDPAFADWWVDRGHETVEATAAIGPGRGLPKRLAASPLSAAPRVLHGVAVLEDPQYGVSYWNLHERPPLPARIRRWAGFRADRPWWLSEHASRVLVLDDPVLSELCGARARALREAGWLSEAEAEADQDELANGLRFDERLRRLHAEAVDAGEVFGDLHSPSGAEAFTAWLREPAPIGGTSGINRYAYSVWRDRTDLQEAYAELDGPAAEGFRGWLWVHGRPELRLQLALLPRPPAWVEGLDRRVPPVVVTGYFRGNLGLGEAARGYLAALQAGGVPVATHSVATDPPIERRPRGAVARPEERPFEDLTLPEGAEPEVNLVCVNADQLPGFASEHGGEILRGRHTIGVWAWETDLVPERWDVAFRLVNEVWTYSSYVAEHIGRAGDVPVLVMPLPVEAPDSGGETVPFELRDGFVFLFAFDFFSTLQRKNPVGLVDAFTRAFEPGEGPTLLLKTINADFRPEARERLRHAIGGREDVMLVDVSLTPGQMAALYARADCYVSLHRSEGYGLTLAESMALGKPVIATGYSGNTDFMTPANSYLVDYEPAAVGSDAEHYPPDATWAEPSVEHAAALMREVWTDQEAARARGARAREDVRATLSREAVGGLVRGRLERIAALRDGRAASGAPPWPLSELDHRLGFDLGGGDRSGVRGVARRMAMRVMRPYTASERALDEAVVASLHRLQTELAAERAARERDRARIARLEKRLRERGG